MFRNKLVQSITSAEMALFLGIGPAIALDPKAPPYLGPLENRILSCVFSEVRRLAGTR